MDRMTRRGDRPLASLMRRWLAHWPALLLPLVAAGTINLLGTPVPQILIILAVCLAAVAPAESAKLTHLALFGYGAYGLFKLHSLEIYESMPVRYGLVTAARLTRPIPGGIQLTARTTGFAAMLGEAVLFLALAGCLLAVSDAPGGRAVRRAVAQLRGSDGEPRTVPPLLLIPVIFLCEELFSERLWFGGHSVSSVLALLAFAAALALIRWFPQLAAVAAVAGFLVLGLYGIPWGMRWVLSGGGYPGVGNAPHFGFVLLDGGSSELLAGLQGIVLLGFGAALAPRLLRWGADMQLAERAHTLTQRVDRLTRTRSDATSTAVAELRRIERDLHDGAQARLVAVGMSLRAAEQLMLANPEAALALISEARETSSRALADLRDLVRGIYPPVLADRGLADAVRTLALDTPMPVETDITLDGEPPMPIAAAVYFGIAEILTNAVRHSGADKVEIGIGYAGGLLRATVTDDGVGGADASRGTGLAGVERRMATFDGLLAVSSPPGGPTIIALEVPCDLASTDAARISWQEKTLLSRG